VPRRAGALLTILLRGELTRELAPARLTLLQELSALVGARQEPAEVADVLEALLGLTGPESARWQMAGLNGLADGMGRRSKQLGVFLRSLPESKRSVAERAEALLSRAAVMAADGKRDPTERLAAVQLLAHGVWQTAEPALMRLITDDPAQEVRLAAVKALAAHPRPEVAGLLMQSWKTYTPAVRREVTEAMLRQPDRIQFFLAELEAGRVKPGDLDALRTRQLVNHHRPDIRDRARKLLQENMPADRKLVLERYQASLKLSGDPKRGKAVFQKNCITCHKVAGIGVDVAPDISDTRTKTPAMLLVDILSPNQAIDSNYVNYVVTTRNGKVLTGIIAAETAASITLRRAENQTDVVLRQDIEEIQSTGVSLMPEGLEKTISIEEMADLLAFLKNWRYLDGEVPFEEKGR
jgi:putative heme-binding domain-containing protein